MKRIALFVLTNLAIIVVLMLFLNVIGAVFGINFAGMRHLADQAGSGRPA